MADKKRDKKREDKREGQISVKRKKNKVKESLQDEQKIYFR